MDAVEGEDDHHDEVGDEQAGVKEIGAVETLKGTVGVVRLEIMQRAVLLRQQEKREQMGIAVQGAYSMLR
jgi:hypothetical protein